MMFATVQDFIDRYGQAEALALTRLDNPAATTVDEDLLERRLRDATTLMASYIGLELTEPYQEVLKGKACEIARAMLDRNRRREDVQLDYDAAIAWCRDVAKGLVRLPVAGGGDVVLPTPAVAELVGGEVGYVPF